MNSIGWVVVSWIPGVPMVLAGFHVVRLADAAKFACAVDLIAAPATLLVLHSPVVAGFFVVSAGFFAWLWWRFRDDDDHRGKRLRKRVRSKLAKPAARPVRTVA